MFERLKMAKRSRMVSQEGVAVAEKKDRISELTGQITNQILSRLSIREAARTSILSTKWRYKWATVPVLVFDDQCLHPGRKYSTNKMWRDMINSVLLFHTGEISKFAITRKTALPDQDMDEWIFHLQKSEVSELNLEFTSGMCELPSNLFFLQDLVHLKLCHCVIRRSSSALKGFKNLKTLELSYVEVAENVLEELISSCTTLEKIKLSCFPDIFIWDYIGPNLIELDLESPFQDGYHRRRRAIVYRLQKEIPEEQGPINHESHIQNFRAHLSRVTSLTLRKSQLKFWGREGINVKYSTIFPNVKTLDVEINFGSFKQLISAAVLLKLPNLQELRFTAIPGVQDSIFIPSEFWENFYTPSSLLRLKFASFIGIQGTGLEVGFIKLLLSKSKVLERMEIGVAQDKEWPQSVTDLLTFKRASIQAKLVYLGDNKP